MVSLANKEEAVETSLEARAALLSDPAQKILNAYNFLQSSHFTTP
jgi:hypothetical protein